MRANKTVTDKANVTSFQKHIRRQAWPEDMRCKLVKYIVADCRKNKTGLIFTLVIDSFWI